MRCFIWVCYCLYEPASIASKRHNVLLKYILAIRLSVYFVRNEIFVLRLGVVGPIDNWPSTDYLHKFVHFFKKDNWFLIFFYFNFFLIKKSLKEIFWHVTGDKWHMTVDWWQMTHDTSCAMNILSKCQLSSSFGLGLRVFDDWLMIDD